MEDLVADKVIAVWPAVGECAVQPVVEFLPDDLKEMIEEPKNCLLPPWEWPASPTKSRVRASQEEWDKIVQRPLQEASWFQWRRTRSSQISRVGRSSTAQGRSRAQACWW